PPTFRRVSGDLTRQRAERHPPARFHLSAPAPHERPGAWHEKEQLRCMTSRAAKNGRRQRRLKAHKPPMTTDSNAHSIWLNGSPTPSQSRSRTGHASPPGHASSPRSLRSRPPADGGSSPLPEVSTVPEAQPE